MQNLNLWLYDNQLTEEPNDYFGKVKSNGNITNADVARLIVEDGSEHKEETIYNIITVSDRLKAKLLAQGYSLNTPLCYGRIGVTGVFEGSAAKFEKEKHKLTANFTQGAELRTTLATITVDVLGVASTGPVIGKVEDSYTGQFDSVITPNNVIKIAGSRIKLEGDDANIGLFFKSVADGVKTKAEQIITNERSELLVMVPGLDIGEYELELTTQGSGGGTLLKEARTITFEHILVVE
ncbi:DNA-binding domain-containing protein [Carboxylicivirga marina]|uniref:DNA-binding domain-containing protein n=1 Tax=Carboxylicivirga marina TaxID=2800988 RepID=UPI00259298AB|nr:DNA-binding domain-containing protein [uncultured Carboxylicivirga sp.]